MKCQGCGGDIPFGKLAFSTGTGMAHRDCLDGLTQMKTCESCGTATRHTSALLSARGIGLSVCVPCGEALKKLNWRDLRAGEVG